MTFVPDVSSVVKASVKAAAKATVKGAIKGAIKATIKGNGAPSNSNWQPAPHYNGGGASGGFVHCDGGGGVHWDTSHGWGGDVWGKCTF